MRWSGKAAVALMLAGTPILVLAGYGTSCGGNDVNVQQSAPSNPTAPGQAPGPTPAPTQINVNITQVFQQTVIVKQSIVNNNAVFVIVNNLNEDHSIDADDGFSFHSGIIRPGETVIIVVNHPGNFPFHCGIHPDRQNERGVLHVDPPSPPSPTPTPTPTLTPSPTPVPTPTPTTSPHVVPSISPTVTPSASPSSSVTPSPTPSASPTRTPFVTPTPSPSVSPSVSPSPSPTPVVSPPGTIIITSGAMTRTSDAFAPGPVTVAQGSTVTVRNDDTITHTLTADDDSFDTGNIPPGEERTFTASQAGDIPFHCKIHPNMTGTLHVVPTAEPEATPMPMPSFTPRGFTP